MAGGADFETKAGSRRRPNVSKPPAVAGFALIIVLWTVVLLTLLVTQIEQAGQSESRLALNLRRAAALQAEADGAIAIGAFHLISGTPSAWTVDGQVRDVRVADDGFTNSVVLRIEDEAGKVDLNTAPAPLLQALLTTVGADPTSAAKNRRRHLKLAVCRWPRCRGGSGGGAPTKPRDWITARPARRSSPSLSWAWCSA